MVPRRFLREDPVITPLAVKVRVDAEEVLTAALLLDMLLLSGALFEDMLPLL